MEYYPERVQEALKIIYGSWDTPIRMSSVCEVFGPYFLTQYLETGGECYLDDSPEILDLFARVEIQSAVEDMQAKGLVKSFIDVDGIEKFFLPQ